ncbi:MAG TPA: hypothetical protein VLK25_13725 [Allosphingosinicella sp.]|nr:hypothetical protein [Allosphingosinicella sp.]
MKTKPRKLVRGSFIAVVTGTGAYTQQAGGDGEKGASGKNGGHQGKPGNDTDS